MADTDFSRLVKALLDKRGLTQEELAPEIGVSFSTVNVWENGHRQLQPYLAKKLLEMATEAGLEPQRTTTMPSIETRSSDAATARRLSW